MRCVAVEGVPGSLPPRTVCRRRKGSEEAEERNPSLRLSAPGLLTPLPFHCAIWPSPALDEPARHCFPQGGFRTARLYQRKSHNRPAWNRTGFMTNSLKWARNAAQSPNRVFPVNLLYSVVTANFSALLKDPPLQPPSQPQQMTLEKRGASDQLSYFLWGPSPGGAHPLDLLLPL